MPLFGELFLSEIIKKPVFDPKGEIIGRVKDVMVVKGEQLPKVAALIIEDKKQPSLVKWEEINIFNKKIISTYLQTSMLEPYQIGEDNLLAVRDILDKQIIDANGAKVVRVNDIKLEGFESDALLVAIDVGMRGILRRLGVERGSEKFISLLKTEIPHNLISWEYLQPLRPELQAITLTVPRQMLSELHPADIADIISQVPREEGSHLIRDLDVETAAEALSELQTEQQADILNALDTEKAADLIEEMSPDEAADVLSDLPAEKAKEILEQIEKEDAEDIQELLGHEDDTAGGLMTNEYIAVPTEVTVQEAIERFRKDAEEIDKVYYVYTVDAEERLTGVVSLRELILAEPGSPLTDIIETKVKSVLPDADEMEVAEMISKYNLVTLPVVDAEGYLLGVVTVDDVLERILPPAAKKKRRRP